MELTEIRQKIDDIDNSIKELLMQRIDCSAAVADAKIKSGNTTIYRPEREAEILAKLGADVPEEYRTCYLAVVSKIIETSRMYQYVKLYDWNSDLFSLVSEGIEIPEESSTVTIEFSRSNQPGSLAAVLDMMGDYGYTLSDICSLGNDDEMASFEITILGNIKDKAMRVLLLQIASESIDFKITNIE